MFHIIPPARQVAVVMTGSVVVESVVVVKVEVVAVVIKESVAVVMPESVAVVMTESVVVMITEVHKMLKRLILNGPLCCSLNTGWICRRKEEVESLSLLARHTALCLGQSNRITLGALEILLEIGVQEVIGIAKIADKWRWR